MQLDQIFKIEFIRADLLAKTKIEALEELVNTIIQGGVKLKASLIIEILQQRENLGSTGIGDGVAIPHGKIPELDELIVAFGRSPEGIAYDSLDGKPAHLFFLLLAPENSSGYHLKVLAKISKMLKIANFRKMLLKAKSQREIYKIIIDQENSCFSS
jgi:nitrogen PTS system EIIA component